MDPGGFRHLDRLGRRSMSDSTARARPATITPLDRWAIACTASKSPGDAAGNPASMTSTPRATSASATSSFSSAVRVAPGDCSPSRSVVSKTMTRFRGSRLATVRLAGRFAHGYPPRWGRSGAGCCRATPTTAVASFGSMTPPPAPCPSSARASWPAVRRRPFQSGGPGRPGASQGSCRGHSRSPAIHSLAKVPSWIWPRICFIVALTWSLTIRGPA